MTKRHLAEKHFHSKTRHRLPISSLLTRFAYLSPFSSYARKIDLIAAQTPPSGENIFIRKPEPDFLLVVRCHVLPKSYRFRVIRVSSIRPLQRRPLAQKMFFSKARPRLPISVLLTLCVYLEPFSSYSRSFTRRLYESRDLYVR
jgi:hypothetical protein